MEAIVSAPGKIFLMGGYSILEKGNVGLVLTVDKRVYVKAVELPFPKVEIHSAQLNVDESGTFESGKNILKTENKKAKFVENAVGTTLSYLAEKNRSVKGVAIHTYSDPAFSVESDKSGLGSSAAVTVATAGALLQLNGIEIAKNLELVNKLSQYSHNMSQGKVGSGFDVSACVYGCQKYSRYSQEIAQEKSIAEAIDCQWDYAIKPLKIPKSFITVVANIPETSASTTEMVAQVKRFKEKKPEVYWSLINAIDSATKRANAAIENLNEKFSPEGLALFEREFEESRGLLRELGEKSGTAIEPPEFSKLIQESKQHGAFVARLPGAGGGDSIVAFCLSPKHEGDLKHFWAKKGLQVLDVKINEGGVKTEEKFPLDGV